MISILKTTIKKIFHTVGFDIVRLPKNPQHSLLGLRHLSIRSVIDVGGNTGQFAKMISNIFPEAYIYTFEPLPEAFEQLKEWAEKETTGKIVAYNLALGEIEGTVEMFSHIEHSTSSSFLKTTKLCESFYPFTEKYVPVPVKMTTLDQWTQNLSRPLSTEILIKLDVQGYEDRVIGGGLKTFGSAKACILEISLDKLYENQATFKTLFLLLDKLGYYYIGNLHQTYADDGHVVYIDAVFVK